MYTRNTRRLLVALGAAGLAAAAAPALAQTADELTVVGKWGPGGPETMSRIVNIADLDLRTDAGTKAMRMRVRATAHDICAELEGRGNGNASGAVRSCEADAVAHAQPQMRVAIAQARTALAYAEPAPAVIPGSYVAEESIPSADVSGSAVSAIEPTYTTTTVTNGPVPDTATNRARFGGPMSNAGKRTTAAGN